MNGLLWFVLKEVMLFFMHFDLSLGLKCLTFLCLLDLSYLDSKNNSYVYSYAQFVFHLRLKVVTITLQCVISG